MFNNYLKIALRNLLRHRLFSGINIAGLAAGMSLGLVLIAMLSALLSKGFAHMLLLAALIALPLMYVLFDAVVLNQFAYRISIGAVELGAGLALLFVLGLLMIGSQTRKAAPADPVEALRGE